MVCLKWAIQRGQSCRSRCPPIRGITWPICAGAAGAPLTAEDMQAIAAIDRNCRLIKGQVFLWPAAKGWEDLWDLDGEITPG